MNHSKKITYIKILSAIFISVIVVNFLSPQIFLSNTPEIRRDIGSTFIAKLKDLVGAPFSFLANLTGNKSVPYTQVAKGVYAKEQNNVTYKLYKDNEVNWLEYRFEYKGKIYIIKYAEGDSVPNKDSIIKLME